VNSEERTRRNEGKDSDQLYPYYGATGQVDVIDDFIFDEELVLLGEDGVSFFEKNKHKAYRVSGKCWVNNHAHVLRPRVDLINQTYLWAYLNQFNYAGYVTGSTRLKLTQGAMKKIPVLLAPISEQKRIADKLDRLLAAVDTCKARLDVIPAILKRFRQSVLAAATSGELTEEWRRVARPRPPSLEAPHQLFDVPDGWLWTRVGDIATVKGGKRLPKGEKLVGQNTGLPYIKAGQLKDGTVNSEGQEYLLPETQKSIQRYIVDAGDVYITIVGACIGDAGVIPRSYHRANLTENAAKLCNLSTAVVGAYLAYWLRSPACTNHIDSLIKSGAQGKLALVRISGIPVPLPSIEEQSEVVRRVESLLAAADRIGAKVDGIRERVDALTQGFLAKAFSGGLFLALRKVDSRTA
jgi:type I restriction enzyme S subunit